MGFRVLASLLLVGLAYGFSAPARADTAPAEQSSVESEKPAIAAPPSYPADPLFDEDYEEMEEGVPDPAEETNRQIFEANQQMDRFVFDPITRGYRFVVPDPLRTGIRNAFDNIDSPIVLANDLLQLEWEDAGITVVRLVLNSTLGIGGLFDVATRMGIEGHDSDFGQTLALAGVPSGPFLMVPIFGPTTLRDGFGTAVDLGMSPTTHLFGPVVLLYYGGTSGLALRDEHFDDLKELEKSSLDYYSTLRSAWWQQRQAALWSRREDRRPQDDYGP